ncbi:hypothetical protein TNCV_2459011 [Trichonephila clavipes]|nr:hypothetical protein TNCV_2459011 [Trichonephila clavipes]
MDFINFEPQFKRSLEHNLSLLLPVFTSMWSRYPSGNGHGLGAGLSNPGATQDPQCYLYRLNVFPLMRCGS